MWEARPFAEGWDDLDPDAIVWGDVASLDRAWRLSDQHIGVGGRNGHGNRYAGIGRWFAVHDHCDMASASLEGLAVVFTDGRHRFAWLRDRGIDALPLQVPPSQADTFLRRFGSEVRQTLLRHQESR
jgi:hypothetical protein